MSLDAVLRGEATWAIVPGDMRAGLAALPAGCVQTCVTSPPYHGLRAYGTAPQLWGGDAACAHEWSATASPAKTGGVGTASAKQVTNHGTQLTAPQYEYAFRNGQQYVDHRLDSQVQGGGVCTRCGAWCGELGSEPAPDCLAWARGEPPCEVCFVCHMRTIFAAVWRVLRADGALWLNLGDSYAGSGRGPTGHNGIGNQGKRQGFTDPGATVPPGYKPKDLMGLPWRVAMALQSDGWYLRMDNIWHKPNPMPESVTDRPTKAHEYLFLLSKAPRYFYDADAIKEPSIHVGEVVALGAKSLSRGQATGAGVQPSGNGRAAAVTVTENRNRRSVWTVPTAPFPDAHFATFPPALVEPCILAGTSERGQCPTCGAPWRRVVARTRYDADQMGRTPKGAAREALGLQGQGTGLHETGWRSQSRPATTTLGWEPSCACPPHEPVPQIVLDPFCGSATSGVVATRLGRRFIGLELNPQYVEMGRKRIIGDAPLWNTPELGAS